MGFDHESRCIRWHLLRRLEGFRYFIFVFLSSHVYLTNLLDLRSCGTPTPNWKWSSVTDNLSTYNIHIFFVIFWPIRRHYGVYLYDKFISTLLIVNTLRRDSEYPDTSPSPTRHFLRTEMDTTRHFLRTEWTRLHLSSQEVSGRKDRCVEHILVTCKLCMTLYVYMYNVYTWRTTIFYYICRMKTVPRCHSGGWKYGTLIWHRSIIVYVGPYRMEKIWFSFLFFLYPKRRLMKTNDSCFVIHVFFVLIRQLCESPVCTTTHPM